MTTQKATSITLMGLLVLAVLFLVVNMASNALFTSVRADLTENKLFTLTQGTLNIIAKVEEPITLYLFYSDKVKK